MKDRLVAGGLAGIIGAIVQNIYGFAVKGLRLTDRTFADFAEVIVTFKSFEGIIAFIVGLIAHLIVGLIFGIIFAYVIAATSSRYYLIKGVAYGAVLWFLLLGFGTIFKLPLFKEIPPNAALFTLVGAVLYGLVTAYSLRLLDAKTRLL